MDNNKHKKMALKLGLALIVTAILGTLYIFYPIISQEIKYSLRQTNHNYSQEQEEFDPVHKGFTINVPKINASASIISNIDPFNEKEYINALTKGVAHAKNTKFPGQEGNMFLFAHSSDNFYNANRYNSVFYLLYKLEPQDEILITFEDKLYRYKVREKLIVTPDNISFLNENKFKNQITLMTCWPPGTTNKRLLIIGEEIH